MGDETSGHNPQLRRDINLMNPEIEIVQDVDQDLEDFTRLAKLGHFGDAFHLFQETLHRHLSCFAVLIEYCAALIDQGDYKQAEELLYDAIGRQTRHTGKSGRFEPEELQLLRLCLAYVRIYNHGHTVDCLNEAQHARAFIEFTTPQNLTDVQRQIILRRLQILSLLRSSLEVRMDEFRLPWSPAAAYPGEYATITEDWLAWFQILLTDNPWDANILLRNMGNVMEQTRYWQDMLVLRGSIDRVLGESQENIDLFARMMLLGTLCENGMSRQFDGLATTYQESDTYRVVSALDVENLLEEIQRILEKHSEDREVTDTRPYKRLQILVIDNDVLRQPDERGFEPAIHQALTQLEPIEVFANKSTIRDYQLSLEVLWHDLFLKTSKQLRRTTINKINRYKLQVGYTADCDFMRRTIRDKILPVFPFFRTRVITELLYLRSKSDVLIEQNPFTEGRCMLENTIYNPSSDSEDTSDSEDHEFVFRTRDQTGDKTEPDVSGDTIEIRREREYPGTTPVYVERPRNRPVKTKQPRIEPSSFAASLTPQDRELQTVIDHVRDRKR